jgi:hypothetical protein
MDTDTIVKLSDGTYAVLHRSMTWGESMIIVLLAAMLFLQVYALWRQR